MTDSIGTRSPRRPLPPSRRGRARLLACLTTLSATVDAASPPLAGASYATPPDPGDILVAVRDTVRCASERGALFTAESGFFAADCRQAEGGGRWRVIACRHVDLADGGLWLVEVRAAGDRNESGTSVWIPLPWHDWA